MNYRGKRILDLVITVPALLVTAPLIAGIAVLVAVVLGKPVLFRQERPGLGTRPFMILKFRTMTDVRGYDGELLPDKDRLTKFGRLLRRSNLDELPELINVLRGDMSLVGPRPLLMRYLPRYSPSQMRRHEVRPGVTGWAQVNGRNAVSWNSRLAMDTWYVDHQSLGLDLNILLRTIWTIVRSEGIDEPGEIGSSEFLGEQGEYSEANAA